MRISTAQYYEATSANLQRINANVLATGQEVSSGIKLNTAADDPAGAARLLQLGQQSAMLTQYSANMSTANTTLTQAQSALKSIQDAMQSASELAVGAANGTLTDADRKAQADQITQIQGQVLSLMNSQDANGQYIFAGSKTGTAPYTQNADGSFSYNGDQTSINVPIGSALSVASNITGFEAFEQSVNTTRTSSSMTSPAVDDGRVSLSGGLVSNSSTFNSTFASGQPYTVTFLSSTQYKITDSSTPPKDVTADTGTTGTFSSANAASQTINFRGLQLNLNVNLSATDNASTASADAAVAGHSFQLTATADTFSTSRSPGNASTSVITSTAQSDAAAYNSSFPPGGAVLKFTSATAFDLYAAPVTANSKPVSSGTTVGTPPTATAAGVTFSLSGAPAVGDSFVVQANTHQSQNVLNTLGALAAALNTKVDGDPVALQKLNASMQSAIGNLAAARDQVSSAQSTGAAVQVSITSQGTTNDTLGMNNTVDQGKITDSDPVAAYTQLTLQTTMLSAAQLAFSKISQLGLFNKI